MGRLLATWPPYSGAPLIFILLALPWYVAMLMIHGNHYISSARADTVGRFSGAMEGHGGTPLFYIPIFLVGFFPWSGWLPFAWYRPSGAGVLPASRAGTKFRRL